MPSDHEVATPIIIVGDGPFALCLALFLDHYGIKFTIINTGETARMHPKGKGQNVRTVEHYCYLGFSDEIRKLGLPNDYPFDQAFFTRFATHEIYRYPALSWDERKKLRKATPVTDQFPEPMYHASQMYVERYLFERVKQCGNIDLRFGWEVTSFVQDEEGVNVTARSTSGGDEARWRRQ